MHSNTENVKSEELFGAKATSRQEANGDICGQESNDEELYAEPGSLSNVTRGAVTAVSEQFEKGNENDI